MVQWHFRPVGTPRPEKGFNTYVTRAWIGYAMGLLGGPKDFPTWPQQIKPWQLGKKSHFFALKD